MRYTEILFVNIFTSYHYFIQHYIIIHKKCTICALSSIDSSIIVGVGNIGCKIALDANNMLDADCLLLSDTVTNIHPNHSSIIIPIDSSSKTVLAKRGNCLRPDIIESIQKQLSHYSRIILIGNLASTFGAATVPTVSWIVNKLGKSLITFGIMPFKFENNKIFDAGVALKRVLQDSTCTILLDNNSIKTCNPLLDMSQCYKLGNDAILYVIKSLQNIDINIAIEKEQFMKDDLQKSLDELYKFEKNNKPPILYLYGTSKAPRCIYESVNYITSMAEQNHLENHNATEIEQHGTVMLTQINENMSFQEYDPLGMIPMDKTLDWDEPDYTLSKKLDLSIRTVI